MYLVNLSFSPSIVAVMDGVAGTRSPAYSLAHETATLPSSRAWRAAMSACSALPRAVAVLKKIAKVITVFFQLPTLVTNFNLWTMCFCVLKHFREHS